MTMTRIIRRIGIWWFLHKQRAHLDAKARQRRIAIAKAQKDHRPVKALFNEQFREMTAKLREEVSQ